MAALSTGPWSMHGVARFGALRTVAPPLATGQIVRVRSGRLQGLEGELIGKSVSGLCTVRLGSFGPGVLLRIDARQLLPIERR